MKSVIERVRRSICAGYDFEETGIGKFLVHTGVCYDDGDEFHIVMRVSDQTIMLTDEGHTLMWLSYENYNFTNFRTELLHKILSQNSVSFDDGRLCASVGTPEEVGPALSSLIQAMMQTANLRYLNRSNVVSTFLDDIRSAFAESDLKGRCEFKKRIPAQDGNVIEPDVYIEDTRPVLVFGASNSERAKEVFINLLLTKELDSRYRTVVIIDGDADISRKDRDRLINAANRPIMGKDDALSVTKEFLQT